MTSIPPGNVDQLDPLSPPIINYAAPIPTVTDPGFGTLGEPVGVKETAQRVDFRNEQFIIAIEAHGYRCAWTRAAMCPCSPINPQTQQADPNCPQCQGSGYFYFGPTAAQAQNPQELGYLTDANRALINKQNAFVIRVLMTGIMSENSPWEKISGWRAGMANVTVRPENRLGYYDRLVMLDSTVVYTEVVTYQGGPALPTRYIVDGGVTLLSTLTKRFLPVTDFRVLAGQILWVSGRAPPAGTRLTVHYFTHPTWLIVTHPHTIRGVPVNFKKPFPQSPEGDNFDMPVQAVAKLEFLVHPPSEVLP